MSGESILENGTRDVLNKSPRDRLSWIQREHWVNTRASNVAFQWMEYLLRSERTERPECLHITGDSGRGKTALLRNFSELHPVFDSGDPLRKKRPVLRVVAKPEDRSGAVATGAASLRYMIMRAAWPDARHLTNHCSVEECDETLKVQGVRLLLIDEGGELSIAGRSAQMKTLSEVRGISSRLSINIAFATVEKYEHVFDMDDQLSKRFKRKIRLPLWEESQDFRNFLSGLEAYLPFPERSHLDRQEMVKWLLLYGEGNTDAVVTLVRLAAMWAISREANFVSMNDFEMAREASLPPPIAIRDAAA